MTRFEYLMTNKELDWRKTNEDLEVGYKVTLRPYEVKVTKEKSNGAFALYVDDILANRGNVNSYAGKLIKEVNKNFKEKEINMKDWAQGYFLEEM